MISLPIRTVIDVAERQQCCGCGACAYADSERIEMVDTLREGRRPRVKGAGAPSTDSMRVCPGVGLSHSIDAHTVGISELFAGWGPVLKIWEGHATDSEVRWAGSSGGAATALALHGLLRGGLHGVLHVKAREDAPYLNRTALSRTREELLAGAGSRYAPASPCDGLGMVEAAPGACLMIGKPCDVAAARLACSLRPGLERNLAVTIAFFCAGTPSTQGTLEMLKAMGVGDPASVKSVRYRGNGWPGRATVVFSSEGRDQTREMSYQESWGGILQKHRQWRCYLCADHTGEFADISVGDPWYRKIEPGEAGTSLIMARTKRGLTFVEEAIKAGFLSVQPAEPQILPLSQPNLLAGRGAVWGRSAMLRMLGLPAPRYRRMPLARWWRTELSLKEQAQSFYGTFRRAFVKGLFRRRPVEAWAPSPNRRPEPGEAR